MQTADAGQSSTFYLIIFLVLIFAMFYFLTIRPQRKRQKQHQELLKELKRGNVVMTVGGVYGQIESITDDNVILKIESGATMKVTKRGIISKES